MQDEGGNIPAHGKETRGQTQYGSAVKVYFPQVFRRQVQGVAAKHFGKTSVDGAEQNSPEYEQHLVLTEM